MAQDRYTIVSSDCHAGAAVEDYKPYLERRWHDEFDAWAATFHDAWLDLDPGPDSARTEDSLKVGVASGAMSANWDSDQRIVNLDADGIAGEVVFPNTAPPFFPSGVFTARSPRTRDEYERRWAGLKAHNRWLVDFCDALPGRRAGIAQIFLNDVDDAVAEIEWARNAGLFGGVLVPVVELDAVVPPLFTDAYDRIWAACVDLDVVANQHSTGAGLYDEYAHTPHGMAAFMIETGTNAHRALWHLIFGGIFERFPRLKFVMTEQGVSWVPERLATLDGFATAGRNPAHHISRFLAPAMQELSMQPSDYFRRNVWIGASRMGRIEVDEGVVDAIGERLMWGSDFPHSEGTFPSTAEFLHAAFFDRPVEEVGRMLGETAVEVYGFDRDAVRRVGDRIGPVVERVHQPVAA